MSDELDVLKKVYVHPILQYQTDRRFHLTLNVLNIYYEAQFMASKH